jgi:hypothetical protein
VGGWRFTVEVVLVVVVVVGYEVDDATPTTRLVLEDDVQGVDDAGNVCRGVLLVAGPGRVRWRRQRLTTEDGQEQVDEEVGTAAALEEDSERRQHDGADDLDDVAVGAR